MFQTLISYIMNLLGMSYGVVLFVAWRAWPAGLASPTHLPSPGGPSLPNPTHRLNDARSIFPETARAPFFRKPISKLRGLAPVAQDPPNLARLTKPTRAFMKVCMAESPI